jgi:hypothetical protein
VICNECGTKFEVNEGSGMIAMPFHCHRCGRNGGGSSAGADRWGRNRSRRHVSAAGRSPEMHRAMSALSIEGFAADPEGSEILYD